MNIKDEMSILSSRINSLRYELIEDGNFESYNKKMEEFNELKNRLEELKKEYKKIYSHSDYMPSIDDGKYKEFPNKASIDKLRLLYYSVYGKDANIMYYGKRNIFDNGFDILSNMYSVRGETPYSFKIKSSDDSLSNDSSASILTTIPTEIFLDEKNENLISMMVNYINDYTSKPINLIYSNSDLENISFARIDNREMNNDNDEKNYYNFFVNMFEDFNRNIIYIGPELQKNVYENDIDSIYSNYIIWERLVTATERGMGEFELKELNEKVKGKILKYNK